MNLRSVDMNLLVILDALLDEAHVSRAAQRLNLSQPAVSNALQRCRDLFGDPLLERGRGTMTRTPVADRVRAPLKSILAEVEAILDPPEVDLSALDQVVRITTADDPTALLARPLVEELARTAPGMSIVFRPWLGTEAATRELLDGDTDLAVALFDRDIENIETRTLLATDYVVAMRRGHPAADAFDLDAWLAWPHVVVSGRGDRRTALDGRLEKMGRNRRVALVLPSFQLVPAILAATDFLAMLPRKSVELREADGLETFPTPIEVEGFPLHLAWHVRQAKDPGVRHVAEIVASVLG